MTAERAFSRCPERRFPLGIVGASILLLAMAGALAISGWRVYQQNREYVAPHPDAPLPKGERARLHSRGF